MKILAEHTDQMSDGQVQEIRRTSGFGASEAGAASGISKWQSPYGLWAYKTSNVTASEVGAAARWGLRLEGVVLDAFTEETGIPTVRPHHIVANDLHPFIFASPDAYALNGAGQPFAVVQAKAPGLRMSDEWADDNVPDEYLLQVQQELYVTGFSQGWLAVLLGGQDFRIIPIDRDDKMIQSLVKIETEMWRRVQENDPPDVDGHRATTETIKRMFPKGTEASTVELDADILILLESRQGYQALQKRLKADLDEVENGIKVRLGDHEIGTVDGTTVVTWKTIHKEGYFVKPSVQRRIRVPKAQK